jgi:phage-related protein
MKGQRTGPPAEIIWEGNSKDVLSSFPHDMKVTLGFSLRQIQNGKHPRCDHRPMSSVGKGVWELKEGDARTWYRVMYLTRIQNSIHILHCFEKESRKTDRRDLETARKRLQEVHQRLKSKPQI